MNVIKIIKNKIYIKIMYKTVVKKMIKYLINAKS